MHYEGTPAEQARWLKSREADKNRCSEHAWAGCKCTTCGNTRDKDHAWKGCKCGTCGVVRDEDHDWTSNCESCSICGKKRRIHHDWSKGSICIKCSTSHEGILQLIDDAGHGDSSRTLSRSVAYEIFRKRNSPLGGTIPITIEVLLPLLQGGSKSWNFNADTHTGCYNRGVALKLLGLLGDKRAVDPLINLSKTLEWESQGSAVWSLGELGDERAVEPLISMLCGDIGRHAVEALGKIGGTKSVEALCAAYHRCSQEDDRAGNNFSICRAIVPALAAQRDARTIVTLLQARNYKGKLSSSDVRVPAEKALHQLADLPALSNESDPQVVLSLIDVLQHHIYHKVIIRSLGRSGSRMAVDALLECLNQVDNENSNWPKFKGQYNSWDTDPISHHNRSYPKDLQWVAEALGILGDPSAENHLLQLKAIGEPATQEAATIALTKLRSN